MTVLEKYNLAVDLVDGDDSLYVGYVSDVESHVPVVVDLLVSYGNVVSLLSGIEKKRINLYYFNGELLANVDVLGIMLRELELNRESSLVLLDEIYSYCFPALRFEVKILSNDVDAFVSVMKSLKDLRFSVESGSVVIEPVVEEPVVASVGVVDGEEIEVVDFESEIDFVEVKKKK
jgi:hypothetical protein